MGVLRSWKKGWFVLKFNVLVYSDGDFDTGVDNIPAHDTALRTRIFRTHSQKGGGSFCLCMAPPGAVCRSS